VSTDAGLPALLAEEPGRELLRSHGIYTEPDAFAAALAPPAEPGLTALLGLPPDALLVHIGQQVCADYHPSVVAKFETAGLVEHLGATPAFLWHDADRAGSEHYGMRIVIPSGDGHRGLWLAHRSLAERELRFVPVEPGRLEEALAGLGRWLASRAGARRHDGRARLDDLAAAIGARSQDTLSAVNGAISGHLLGAALGISPPVAYLSTMLSAGVLTDAVNAYLAALDDVVAVFNESLEALRIAGVDPGLKPLGDDHLPLFYSCPASGTRLRLRHERSLTDHWGTARCRCGEEHRFHLGSREPSLGELEPTGRWSPDISLPVHHNELASGWVVGRSSALYGMVFNAVGERALGRRPIPALVAPGLLGGDADPDGEPLSLLLKHLTR
jgi:hypothetical protein